MEIGSLSLSYLSWMVFISPSIFSRRSCSCVFKLQIAAHESFKGLSTSTIQSSIFFSNFSSSFSSSSESNSFSSDQLSSNCSSYCGSAASIASFPISTQTNKYRGREILIQLYHLLFSQTIPHQTVLSPPQQQNILIFQIIYFSLAFFKVDMTRQHKWINLIVGALGIYLFSCGQSFLQQLMLTTPFYNHNTLKYDMPFKHPQGMTMIQKLFSWLLALIYNKIALQQTTKIPLKNSLICGLIILVANLTAFYSIVFTSLPVVMVFKSGSLLVVIMVAVFVTRVKDQKQKIGREKFITAIIITIGVFIFNIADPQSQNRNISAEIIGIVLLIISLLADGFYPDFQAEIKTKFSPTPIQMMEQINKYGAILSFIFCIGIGTLFPFITYSIQHYNYGIYVLLYSTLGVSVEMVKYWMIKQFKQHIVPFIMASRKIITILISIFVVGHDYSWVQFMCVFVIFGALSVQFITESKKKAQKENILKIKIQINQNDTRY